MCALTELAQDVLSKAEAVDAMSKRLPPDSRDNDNLALAPLPELEALQNSLADSCQQMRCLALGPEQAMMDMLYSVRDPPKFQITEA